MAFDSAVANSADSTYYNFFRLNDTLTPGDTCFFWGSQDCYKQDKPVWIGRKIVYENLGAYKFFPNSGDTMLFDFTKSVGDTSLFYTDGIQKFAFVFEKTDTLTTLNYFDSVRFYKILHTDLAGIIINSQLNGEKLMVGKNLGLIQFFQVDSFPQILRPLYLIGSQMPGCGMFQLTDEIVYDHQPGDEIQFSDYSHQNPGPPWANFHRYIKYVFLNRTETIDSLKYKVIRTFYDVYAWQTTIDTITLEYYKHHVIAQIPYEYYNGSINRFYPAKYCGMKLWSYTASPIPYLGYCSIENCWGGVDTNGPPLNSTATYVAGLGLYFRNSYKVVPNSASTSSKIIYFKKRE